MQSIRPFFIWLMLGLTGAFVHAQSNSAANADPVLLKTMQQELDRAMSSLSKAEPAPYFISYSVDEESGRVIMASNGALIASMNRHERTADVTVRVGTRQLDNTHGENRFHATTSTALPLDDR